MKSDEKRLRDALETRYQPGGNFEAVYSGSVQLLAEGVPVEEIVAFTDAIEEAKRAYGGRIPQGLLAMTLADAEEKFRNSKAGAEPRRSFLDWLVNAAADALGWWLRRGAKRQ